MSILKTIVSAGDHTRGAENAKIQIVEYGNFQCPHCAAAESLLRGLLEYFCPQISVTFRNFPLTDPHTYAFDAACAAEAAGKQGKYWEMHDLIYDNQDCLGDDLFMELAERLGLNEINFVSDTISPAVHAKIKEDFKTGAESGVKITPAFYLDGKRVDGSIEDLFALIIKRLD